MGGTRGNLVDSQIPVADVQVVDETPNYQIFYLFPSTPFFYRHPRGSGQDEETSSPASQGISVLLTATTWYSRGSRP